MRHSPRWKKVKTLDLSFVGPFQVVGTDLIVREHMEIARGFYKDKGWLLIENFEFQSCSKKPSFLDDKQPITVIKVADRDEGYILQKDTLFTLDGSKRVKLVKASFKHRAEPLIRALIKIRRMTGNLPEENETGKQSKGRTITSQDLTGTNTEDLTSRTMEGQSDTAGERTATESAPRLLVTRTLIAIALLSVLIIAVRLFLKKRATEQPTEN
jgi:hypothetical protein